MSKMQTRTNQMGNKVVVGSLPREASSKGNLNESTPAEQRKPEGAPEGAGPVVGERGEYKPASYKTRSGAIRTDR